MLNKEIVTKKIQQLHLTKWSYDTCQICNYRMHFLFQGDIVYHDQGCSCIDLETPRQRLMPSSPQEVVNVYDGLDQEQKEKANLYWKL